MNDEERFLKGEEFVKNPDGSMTYNVSEPQVVFENKKQEEVEPVNNAEPSKVDEQTHQINKNMALKAALSFVRSGLAAVEDNYNRNMEYLEGNQNTEDETKGITK